MTLLVVRKLKKKRSHNVFFFATAENILKYLLVYKCLKMTMELS